MTAWRRWTGRLIKLSIIIAVLLAVALTVLSQLGGNSEELRLSTEEVLSNVTERHVRVGRLNGLTFFPDLMIDADNVEIFEKRSDDIPIISIGHLVLSFGFFDITLGRGDVKQAVIEEAFTLPGALLDVDTKIKFAGLREDAEGTIIVAEGEVGGDIFFAQTQMQKSEGWNGVKYRFQDIRDLKISRGEIDVIIPMTQETLQKNEDAAHSCVEALLPQDGSVSDPVVACALFRVEEQE